MLNQTNLNVEGKSMVIVRIEHRAIRAIKLITETQFVHELSFFFQKKCEVYWPESAEDLFVPAPGSPLSIKYQSMLSFAEFVIRKMVVTHVRM